MTGEFRWSRDRLPPPHAACFTKVARAIFGSNLQFEGPSGRISSDRRHVGLSPGVLTQDERVAHDSAPTEAYLRA